MIESETLTTSTPGLVPTPTLRERLGPLAGAAALVVLAAIVPYLGVLETPFVFDDVKLVAQNTHLQASWEDPSSLLGTFNITSREWAEEELRPNYRPLRFLSYMADFALSRWVFGDFPSDQPPPFFFHLSNVLIHALNALLIFVLARRLFAAFAAHGHTLFVGFAAGLLFALHPLQTEAVTYVSGRRDVLSTAFFLAAVVLFLGPTRRQEAASPLRLRVLVGVPLLLAGGLLCKEMVATLPGLLLLLDLLRPIRWESRRVFFHATVWVLALGHTFANISTGDVVAASSASNGWLVALTSCRYIVRYLSLTLLPVSQSLDYSYDAIPVSEGLGTPWTTVPAVVLVVALVASGLVALVKGRSAIRACARIEPDEQTGPARVRSGAGVALWACGILWFLGTLVPVLQIVPIPERFAERFAYLPGIGVVLLVTAGLWRLARFESLMARGTLILLAVVGAVATVDRNRDWQSPLTLWGAAVEAQPRAARAHLAYANALKRAGRLREAQDEYTAALARFGETPDLPLHHGFILQALTLRGQVYGMRSTEEPELLERAILDYRTLLTSTDTDGVAIADSPKHTVIHFDLAGFLFTAGRFEEARSEYQKVIELGKPETLVAAAKYYLARLTLRDGNIEAAETLYREALELTPAADPAYVTVASELLRVFTDQKKYDEAWKVLEDALRVVDAVRPRSHFRLRQAEILDRRGDLAGARELLETILRKDPDYEAAKITIAGIEANLGNPETAAEHYREILRKDPFHAAASKGLRELGIRKAAGGGAEQDPNAEALAVLDGLVRRGGEHKEKGELLMAVKVYRELFKRARELERDDLEVTACSEMAELFVTLGNSAKAAEYLEYALRLRPDDPPLLLKMGDVQTRLGSKTAKDFYERYVERAPGDDVEPRVFANLANWIWRDETELAIVYCLKAREGGFDGPSVDLRLGYCYAKVEDWESSLDAFNRFLESPKTKKHEARDAVLSFVRVEVLPKLLPKPQEE